jgi:hypothetical protein
VKPILVAAALLVASCQLTPVASTADQIDVFNQKQHAVVDVLWMVDNSPSMAEHQAHIAARIHDFFKQLIATDVDYHVGVVSADLVGEHGVLRAYTGPAVPGCDGCRVLTNAVPCPNPDAATDDDAALVDSCPAELVFKNLVQTGSTGPAFDQQFDNVAAALGVHVDANGVTTTEPPAENAGFVRDEASLHLIFVSDEDEGAKNDAPPVEYYARAFRGLKGAGNEAKVVASAIAGYADDEPVPIDRACAVLDTTYDADPLNDDPQAHALATQLTNHADGCVDPAAPTDPSSFAEPGARYIELACRTNGALANMCSLDYSAALEALGANAAGLLRTFTLSIPKDLVDWGADCTPFTHDDANLDCDGDKKITGPHDSPLCVTATGLASSACPSSGRGLVPRGGQCGYTFDFASNSVRFDGSFLPAPGSELRLHYGVLPTPACLR